MAKGERIELQVKDEDGEYIVTECDDYTYDPLEKYLLVYEMNGDQQSLVAAYNNIKYFKRVDGKEKDTK